MRHPLVRASLLAVGVAMVAPAALLQAHELGALEVEVGALQASRVEITLTVDPEHLPPGIVPLDTPSDARGVTALHLLSAGMAYESGEGELPVGEAGEPVLWTTATVSGSTLLHQRFSLELSPDASSIRIAQRLDVGVFVVRAAAIEGADAPLHWVEGGSPGVEIAFSEAVSAPSYWQVFVQYLGLGFTHIVPKGLDHICFVLGLFLLSTQWRPLLLQVSAFTAAHTLTLAASIYGVVRLSPSIVEPLIALSIAWVAIENLATSELRPWRTALVFSFGLLHGLGFAGVLSGLGLPRDGLLPALLSFNLGVELGQLAVLAAAFALVGLLRRRAEYRRWIVVPASLAIAAVGLFWFVERAFLQR
jgi:hypothetical protein